jgi:type II secretory pathway pseudopilin PulG
MTLGEALALVLIIGTLVAASVQFFSGGNSQKVRLTLAREAQSNINNMITVAYLADSASVAANLDGVTTVGGLITALSAPDFVNATASLLGDVRLLTDDPASLVALLEEFNAGIENTESIPPRLVLGVEAQGGGGT